MCLNKFGFKETFRKWVKMLLFKSKITIQSNGFISEFISVTRSIKQGCPLAPLLYILHAEPMACSIRQSPNIVGIKLPENNFYREAKLNQFVDDTQFFVKNESYIPYILDILKNYELASGAKINKDKTKGLLIGKLKEKNPSFNDINWTRDFVKTLGICHSYNINSDQIWRDKIQKIKSCLQVWKSRNLTLNGKALIIETFVHSLIYFEIETRGIPDIYAKELDTLIYDFMWDGKKSLIAKSTLKRDKKDGGLKLYDISDLQLVLNVKLFYKLTHDPEQTWNIIGKNYLKVLDSTCIQNYFICQITCFERIKLIKKIPKFYEKSLKGWSSFLKSFKPTSHKEILDCNIFANDHVKNRNKPIFFKQIIRRNIRFIGDIWNKDLKRFYSNDELILKYGFLSVSDLQLLNNLKNAFLTRSQDDWLVTIRNQQATFLGTICKLFHKVVKKLCRKTLK